MSGLTVRIDEVSHKVLREMAEMRGSSMQALLAQAIEELRRKLLLDEINQGFAALRQDPKAWKQEQDERAAWDATLSDALDD